MDKPTQCPLKGNQSLMKARLIKREKQNILREIIIVVINTWSEKLTFVLLLEHDVTGIQA